MEKWKKMSYMVAVFMFLIELRPLEPYLTAYQTGPNGNISLSEVANTMALIKSFMALFGSLVMSITADYLLYKPNIIFLTVWACFSYVLMIGSPGLMRQMVAMAGIGAMYSSIMVVFSYLFAQIEDIHQFQIATGIASASIQLGKVVGDFLAEVIVNATGGNYTALPYCTAFTSFLAIIWACLFPPVVRKNSFPKLNVPNEKSRLLNYDKETTVGYYEEKHDKSILYKEHNSVASISKEMWINFKTSYSNPTVLKKCIWQILGVGAYTQVLCNVNILYSYVVEKPGNHDTLSNGYAEAMVTLFGAAGAYLIGKVRLDWTRYCDIFTAVCSFIMGILIMSCCIYDHLIPIYLTYILFGLVCQAQLVIITSEIAKQLNPQCYSLVFEVNYLGSSLVVTIMTLFFTKFNFMNITIPGRFLYIGGVYLILGKIFLLSSLFKGVKK